MQRQQQIIDWLHGLLPDEIFTLSPASADASFRRYFRVSFQNHEGADAQANFDGQQVGTLIVMDAPQPQEDCRPFLHVARLLERAGVHVPHVYAHDLEQGFLLLSDLGNSTFLQALQGRDSATARELYDGATDALIRIQLATRKNELPPYDEKLLRREMNLFPEWYIGKHLNVTLSSAQTAKLETVFARIIANNLAQPHVYVHRDYHSRNLMHIEPPLLGPSLRSPLPQAGSTKSTQSTARQVACGIDRAKREERSRANEQSNFLTSPGILDFQDAVYGPITYDLASLFKDAYIHWEEASVIDWLIRYWEKARKAGLPVHEDFSEFYRDYEWMGVQRHLKVLGIFARLYYRDGKDGYLKDLPLVMAYLRTACARYIDLKPLLNLLNTIDPQNNKEGYTF